MLKTETHALTTHPLEPLSKSEIEAAVAIVKSDSRMTSDHRFVSLELNEPDKQTVLDFTPDNPVDREAFVILLDRSNANCVEAVVSLAQEAVTSWRIIERGTACHYA